MQTFEKHNIKFPIASFIDIKFPFICAPRNFVNKSLATAGNIRLCIKEFFKNVKILKETAGRTKNEK